MKRLAALLAVLLLAGCGWWSGLQSTGPPQSTQAMASECGIAIAAEHLTDYTVPSTLAAELPDGSLVVGAARVRHSRLQLTLRRVRPGCSVQMMAPVSLRAGRFASIDAMVATPQGRLIVAGSDGRHELVGRLFANGRPDPSFGQGGWTRLTPKEPGPKPLPAPVFDATSIAFGPAPSIDVGGNDGGPHCCVRSFVSLLNLDGTLVRGFGHDGSVMLPFGGSYTTELSANADGSIVALGEYEESGCGGPSIVRIRGDGRLDAHFDAAVRQTLASISTAKNHLRFTPTLVGQPDGGFLLVGGLDKTCAPGIPRGGMRSGGVAVAVASSGRTEGGLRRFPSPNYAFDSATALRLASGQTLAAAFAYTAKGKFEGLLVQGIEANGSVGSRHRLLPPIPRTEFGTAALLPAAGDSVWVVVGLPREIDLLRVATGS